MLPMPLASWNDLHKAVFVGSVARTVAALAKGEVDIDQSGWEGYTPLNLACFRRNARIVKILLNKGANISLVNDAGFNALHMAAQEGHLAVTKLLLRAGADLHAKTTKTGCTPLNLAAEWGRTDVLRILIEAGGDPNSRAFDSSTPLYVAAQHGHVETVKLLLRANADPLLFYWSAHNPTGTCFVPLDAAVERGHLEVVRELIQRLGIEGCGGASGGVDALCMASTVHQLEIMDELASAGVVDTGAALLMAAMSGSEPCVKFLLQQPEWRASGEEVAYLDALNCFGGNALVSSIAACGSRSPRITRMLVDAGADTTTAVRLTDATGAGVFDGTHLAYTNFLIREKKMKAAPEEELHSLEATRRLLMRVEAVHAVSWLWANDAPSITHAAVELTGRAATVTSPPLTSMLPVLRRRARRPRVLLAALFRNVEKP